MESFDLILRKRAQEEPFFLPEEYAGRVFAVCAALEEKTVKTKLTAARRWLIGAAAAVALFVAIPNVSGAAAAAMAKIPVLGPVVEVITFRHYTRDDQHTHADVSVPKIEGSGAAAASVNADVQAYTDRLLKQFQADCEDIGEAYEGLDVSYDVLTDSDTWFTLRVFAVETMASGYEFGKIYNIDKTTDQVVPLSGLFRDGTDWQTVLTDEVSRQMEARMAKAPDEEVYFPEEFTGITGDRNYYLDRDGGLVLVFDEYEIAPGSMGAPEFTVDRSVYRDLLK